MNKLSLAGLFGLLPGDLKPLRLIGGGYAALAMGLTGVSITAMSCFLSSHPASSIPWILVIKGVTALAGLSVSLKSKSRAPSLVIASVSFAVIGGALAVWLFLWQAGGFGKSLTVAAPARWELIWTLGFITFADISQALFLTLADHHVSSHLTIREIKRLGGHFQNAILLGMITGAGIYSWTVRFGFGPIIAGCAILLPAGVWLIRRPLGRPAGDGAAKADPPPVREPFRKTVRYLMLNPFFGPLLGILALWQIYLSIFSFESYQGIRQIFRSRDDLALFLGTYEMTFNGLAAVIQTALTPFVLRKLPPREQLLFFPGCAVLICAGWFWTHSVWVLIAGYAGLDLFRRGILYPARQAWTSLLPSAFRETGILFIGAIYLPAISAVTGLALLLGGSRLGSGRLVAAAVVLAIIQILVQFRLNQTYLLALLRNISLQRADELPPAYHVSSQRTQKKIIEHLSRHQGSRFRKTLAKELARFPTAESLGILLGLLCRAKDKPMDPSTLESLVTSASRMAHALDRPDAVKDILLSTRHAPWLVRSSLVDSLVQWGRADFIPQLKEIYMTGEPIIARKACYGIALLAREESDLRDMLEMLRADLACEDSRRRACATAALGEIGHPVFIRSIEGRLYDASPEVRAQALSALRRQAPPAAGLLLTRYKNWEKLPELRGMAAQTAAAIDAVHRAGLPALLKGLSSEERRRVVLLASKGAYPASFLAALSGLRPEPLRRRFIRSIPLEPSPSFLDSFSGWLRAFKGEGAEIYFTLDVMRVLKSALAGPADLRAAVSDLVVEIREFVDKEPFLATAAQLGAAISGAGALARLRPGRVREIQEGLIGRLLEILGLHCRDRGTFQALLPKLLEDNPRAVAQCLEFIQHRLGDRSLGDAVENSIEALNSALRPGGEPAPRETAALALFARDLLSHEEVSFLDELRIIPFKDGQI